VNVATALIGGMGDNREGTCSTGPNTWGSPPSKAARPAPRRSGGSTTGSRKASRNLDHIKDAMVEQARADGADAIVDLRYGQRSPFSMDDVHRYATGATAILP
jgi:hypothetical protein